MVPAHPHRSGEPMTNRPPTRLEVEAGRPFVDALAAGRRTIAVGRVAGRALGVACDPAPVPGRRIGLSRGAATIRARRTRGPPLFCAEMKTWNAKPAEVQRRWYIVDAEGQTLGRLATQIADTLRGKRKPEYTPHVDTGDFVVVVNAEKVAVTGKKLEQKLYHRHSGYPGGLRSRTLAEQLERRPTR